MSRDRQVMHAQTTLRKLKERGVATNTEIGTNSVEILRLEALGLVQRAGTRHTNHRGRPAVEWRLTDKARKRVNRAMQTA